MSTAVHPNNNRTNTVPSNMNAVNTSTTAMIITNENSPIIQLPPTTTTTTTTTTTMQINQPTQQPQNDILINHRSNNLSVSNEQRHIVNVNEERQKKIVSEHDTSGMITIVTINNSNENDQQALIDENSMV
jgi:hypothetical protein